MKKLKLFTGFFLCLFLISSSSKAQLIEHALEDKGTMDFVLHNGTINMVTSPVRAGNFAFRHQVSTTQKRAEIDDKSWHAYDAKGNVFWYGMSYYLPASSFGADINSYVAQFRFSNIHEGGAGVQNCTTRGCNMGGGESGSGHHIKVNNNLWEFTLRHQDPDCANCRGSVTKKFDFGSIATNKWTDFVIQAKWSHNADGFLKVWKQVEDGGYEVVCDYQGPTWYDKYADGSNREGQDVKAPNFTIGLYWSNKSDTRTMYTDEIRVYQQETGVDGFTMVRPDQHNIECLEEEVPKVPSNFAGEATASNQITLTWQVSDDTETGYFIERKVVGKGTFELHVHLDNGVTSFIDKDLEDDATYLYRISAYNCFGSSSFSNETSVYLEKNNTQLIPVASISASNYLGSYRPENVVDGKSNTYWLIEGENEWLEMEMDGIASIERLKASFIKGNDRSYSFSISISMDGLHWMDAGSFASAGITTDFEEFELNGAEAKYVRFITGLNSVDDLTWLAEIQLWGYLSTSVRDEEVSALISVHHSQLNNSIEIVFNDDSMHNSTLMVYNILGLPVYTQSVNASRLILNVNGFTPGIYFIQLYDANINHVHKIHLK